MSSWPGQASQPVGQQLHAHEFGEAGARLRVVGERRFDRGQPAQRLARRAVALAQAHAIHFGSGIDAHQALAVRPLVETGERYQALVAAEREAYYAGVKESLKELKAGKVRKFKSAAALLKTIEAEDDE